ncbi:MULTISPECIES: TVP38/TMEM64 family protein [unclassified Haladaptatus]|uniref:TVP38/TMEM64 family protein n=1 Tax=unclassified Haladaptatus TaxID=2622732 RepID=UPI0023E80B88|nr:MULTISPECIES: VTT domain-containing protein [unclassified Haladaptatus]
MQLFVSAEGRRGFLLRVAALFLFFVALALLSRRMLPLFVNPEFARETIAAYGPLAPLAFIAVQVLQVVFAPIPGQAMGVVSGYLFGAYLGTFYSVVGAGLGSFIAAAAARRFGRPYVERVVHPDTLSRFDGVTDRRGEIGLFLAFLVPGLPDDAICFVAGLTRLSLSRIVVIAVVGRAPSLLLTNLVGAELASRNLAMAAVLGLLVLVLSILGYTNRETLADWVVGDGS